LSCLRDKMASTPDAYRLSAIPLTCSFVSSRGRVAYFTQSLLRIGLPWPK
jgi:hypothetical protein